jgi:hypothetical protein
MLSDLSCGLLDVINDLVCILLGHMCRSFG